MSVKKRYRTTDVVKRQGKLYNKVEHTYEFDKAIDMNVVWLFLLMICLSLSSV